jgi:hypothetical protein
MSRKRWLACTMGQSGRRGSLSTKDCCTLSSAKLRLLGSGLEDTGWAAGQQQKQQHQEDTSSRTRKLRTFKDAIRSHVIRSQIRCKMAFHQEHFTRRIH